jgi:DNA-binding NtrC family response regulator
VIAASAEDIRNASPGVPHPVRAFAVHGKGTRKRRDMASNSVFVVDDEHTIASSLAAILKMHGYSATYFTSSLEALNAARSKTPDLLISDVAMPGISGIDLAIQIKIEYPACKILLFSGQAATLDLLEDARSQGHDFQLLEKPVHPSTMLAKIGALAAGSDRSTRCLYYPL